MRASSIFHTATKHVEIKEIDLPALGDNEVAIKTRYSAISPGTESMIYRGQMPRELGQDKTIQSLKENFDYPFRYGYSLVGEITDTGKAVDREWLGRMVFAFHPHQTLAIVAFSDCLPIPDDISLNAALFLPNVESALNFVMDANPIIGARVIVLGLGVVGLLTTALLVRFPLMSVATADPLAHRRQKGIAFGASTSIDPMNKEEWDIFADQLFQEPGMDGFDIAFETSGNMDALNQAIAVTGFSGTIIVASWYGRECKPLDLGGYFHRRRIRLISSQVSTINPVLSGRWCKKRRIQLAWEMIRRIKPESLITHRFPLEHCSQAYKINNEHMENALQIIFEY